MPHALLPVEITANNAISPRLRRLTFTSEALRTHRLTGPDEFFGLVMPQPGHPFEPLDVDGVNIRAAVADIAEAARPDLRWYTIRRHRPADASIDVDIVDHGDTGPGSRWMRRATTGQTAGMFTCQAMWSPPAGRQLLMADPTALPALRHILDYQAAHNPKTLKLMSVVAIVADRDEIEDGLEHWADHVADLHVAPNETRALDHLTHGLPVTPTSAWISGEGGLTKAVRRLAIREWGLNPDDVVWVPYWFRGRARP